MHDDYNNYDEFGPEPLEIPDGLKDCGNCAHFRLYDPHQHMPIFDGRKWIYGGQCTCISSGGVDFENDSDIPDGFVFVLVDGRPCGRFEPCARARAEAADWAEQASDPYAYNGVSERDFY